MSVVLIAIAHEQNSVRQQDGFIDIMGNHENCLLCLTNNAHQFILNGAARQGIQGAK